MSASRPAVYLDMNIYKRPFDDQRQMRIQIETLAITMVFSFIESGMLLARWSFVLDYENSLDPVPDRRAFVQDVSLCCAEIVEPDDQSGNWPYNLRVHRTSMHEMPYILPVPSSRAATIYSRAMIGW